MVDLNRRGVVAAVGSVLATGALPSAAWAAPLERKIGTISTSRSPFTPASKTSTTWG